MRSLALLPSLMFVLAGFTACAEKTASPSEVIDAFYRSYLDHLNTPSRAHPPFSQALTEAIAANDAVCARYVQGGKCGWNANGNPFLNAQDHDDTLTYQNSDIHIVEEKPDRVKVSLNLFPFAKTSEEEPLRQIYYKMVWERGTWKVDDLWNPPEKLSLRQLIQKENEEYTNPGSTE